MQWYALRCRPQYEQRLEAALLPRFEAFYPWREQRFRIGSDRARLGRVVRKPFFPGYVFARFEHLRELPVLTIPQGWRLVSESPIPDIEIESVRILMNSKLPCGAHPCLTVGDTVRVTRGALEGLEGKILRFKEGQLLIVSIPMLNVAMAAEVPGDAIEVVSVKKAA